MCQEKVEENPAISQNTPSEIQSTSSESQSHSTDIFLTPENVITEYINPFLNKLCLSPMKSITQLRRKSKIKYAKQKVYLITEALQKQIKKIIHIPDNVNILGNEDTEDLNILMEQLREKISVCDNRTEVRYLTLVPPSWTITKTKKYFSVGKRIVRRALELRAEKGILPEAKQHVRRGIDPEVVQRVRNFYCDDEGVNSRILPGLKDRVRIAKNCYEQKRLVLCTLKELFVSYKEKYPEDQIGFTKFCLLRPKQCVLPGASGTHSICVCVEHQNFKLLLSAVGTSLSYKDVIAEIVCNVDSRDCIFRTCSSCPDRDEVEKKIGEASVH